MADYKRLVSYIYSYAGGIKEKNVGFAKAEIRNGQFRMQLNLRGIYTDTPETMGVYFLLKDSKDSQNDFLLLKTGNILINQGIGKYQDIFNPDNINGSGWTFNEIKGVSVGQENNKYYMMFSLWDDISFDSKKIKFLPDSAVKLQKVEKNQQLIDNEKPQIQQNKKSNDNEESQVQQNKKSNDNEEPQVQQSQKPNNNKKLQAQQNQQTEIIEKLNPEIEIENQLKDNKQLKDKNQNLSNDKCDINVEKKCEKIEKNEDNFLEEMSVESKALNEIQIKLKNFFEKENCVDAFDDDYYYDCVEATPEELKKLPIDDDAVINNSFLMHGYYNYKHVLAGRVRDNDNGTHFFIGVPGMYCNRERFMASMFGFNNFKKSHRSDYNNPYFGYWYQEI